MCDTLVALPRSTALGATLFAKNSDRERNEAQVLEVHGRRRRDPSGVLKLTYISIPDVEETHACLISRPFWMWGAEMGANEHGVVIGNEALHAKTPAQRKRALTGMDLLRLALERAATAAQAVEVIVDLLERHGQGGDCGHLGRFYYNNGFIIADASEAFVLETAGRWWALQRVGSVRALSNAYSIGTDYDRVSPAFADHARAEGWTDPSGRFDVAAQLIDEVRDRASFGRGRCARGQGLLEQDEGRLTPSAMAAILRDHGESPGWTPAETVGRTICMHAAEGPRRSQSVASMISEIGRARRVHWVTGTSAPCLSLFKPVVLGLPLPAHGPAPSDRFDAESLWWRHERFHRAALKDFHAGHAVMAAERDALEQTFQQRIDAARDDHALSAAIAQCWREADAAEACWRGALPAVTGSKNRTGYDRSWARLNQVARFPRT
jgi:secernin